MTALFGPTNAIERAHYARRGQRGIHVRGPHDVFTPLTVASTVGGLDLMTNVAIAFPRNPVQLAHQANDMRLMAQGRFTLGLGTQAAVVPEIIVSVAQRICLYQPGPIAVESLASIVDALGS